MACRLLNLHHSALRVDLRGGRHLLLAPGERSAVLHEEWLYDNHHLADWERAGWLRRLPARLSDDDQPAAAAAAPRRKPAAPARPKAADAATTAAPTTASTTARKTAR